MATSGTAVFFPDIVECVEEAYEQAGLEMRSGYDLRTARRSLNLLALDWANRGYNLWTVDQQAIPLSAGVSNYILPADTIDIVEMVLRDTNVTPNVDIAIARISMSTYATIPVKTTPGRPVQVWVNRQAQPQVNVWPVPNVNTYTLMYWRLRRIQDTGKAGQNTMDIPQRFLPPLISGLAYKIAMKRPEAASRVQALKAEYEEQWMNASAEDREKSSIRIVPGRMYV